MCLLVVCCITDEVIECRRKLCVLSSVCYIRKPFREQLMVI